MKVPLYWSAGICVCLGLAFSAMDLRPVAVGLWLLATFCAAMATQFKEK